MYSRAGWAAWKTFITTMVATRPATYPPKALQGRSGRGRGGKKGGEEGVVSGWVASEEGP
jgi:hypothetical protein